jgi:hypothetical protein
MSVKSNIAVLKKLRDDYYRITLFKVMSTPDSDPDLPDNSKVCDDGGEAKQKRGARSEVKYSESLSRSRSRVYDLSICNDWEHFITMTIDGAKHDRHNLRDFSEKLMKWINNYNGRYNTRIKYLLIPEPHSTRPGEKEAWHMHGLVMGLPESHLKAFSVKDKIPEKMRKLIREGRALFNWPSYAEAFGWVSVERIAEPEAVAKYITKYITKRMGAKIAINDHVYYCSKGLKRARVIYKGGLMKELDADYVNKYMAIKRCRSLMEAAGYFRP